MNSKLIKIKINTCLTVVAACCVGLSASSAAQKPTIPADGQKIFILGQDKSSIQEYMNDAELPRPNGFTTYTTLTRGSTEPVTNYCFKGLDGLKNLDNYNSNSATGCSDSVRRNQWGSGVQNAQWVIETYQPEVVAIGMFCPGNSQAQGLYQNGTHDDLLTELSDFFKEHPTTRFFLRTCYEFNGDAHGLSTDSFKGIFKYVRTYLDGQGVNNVAHVWQSDAYHGTARTTSPLGNTEQGYWPGKQYVDWVGVSQFNSDINEEASIAEAEGLPLFIAEVTPHGDLGVQYDFSIPFNSSVSEGVGQPNPVTVINNLNWFDQKNAEIMRASTKAWAYINADWTVQPQWQNAVDQAGANFFKYTDSRVQQSAEVKSRFISLVSPDNGFILDGDTVPTNAGPAITACTLDPASPLNLGDNVMVSCNVSDSPEGVASASLTINGVNNGTLTLGNGAYSWNVLATALNAGTNQLIVSATDTAGANNSQALTAEVVDDSVVVAPLSDQGISVDGDVATLFFKDEGWTATWNYLCINNNCLAGTRIGNNFELDVSNYNIVIGNSYDIQLKVQDNASGQYISPTYTVVAVAEGAVVVTPENQLPVVSISPLSALTAGDNTTVTVNASDNDGTITNVAFYLTTPSGAEQLVGSDSLTPYQFSLTSLIAGTYSMRAVATDNDGGLTTETGTFNVAPDSTNGEPPVNNATYGIEINGNTATMFFTDEGWSATWNYLCIASDCRVGTKNGSRFELDISNMNIVAGNSYDIQFKVQDNTTGQYISPMRTVVAGAAGDDGGGDPIIITPPDGIAPTVNVVAPTSLNVGDNTTIMATASDSDGTVSNVALYVTAPNSTEQLFATDTSAPYQYNLTNLLAGTYYLRALATDNDGDQAQSTASFLVAASTGGGNNGGGTGSPDFAHLDWTSNSLTEHNVGPPPRANPPSALASPTTGATPTLFGFAFDVVGSDLTWRWGPSIVKQAGDSGLEMHCSTDNNATFTKVDVVGNQATIPCTGDYTYFFRYLHPSPLNDDPGSQWIFTTLFTTEGARVDPRNYTPFVDGSANWMRFRHPITQDGVTAAILDAQHNNDRLRNLDRYTIWVEDSPGNVEFKGQVNGSILRNEAMRRAGSPNGQQFFAALTSGMGWGDLFSYGQVISFEFTAVAGKTGAQTYNDFSHYVVGCGWCGKYGDPRLNSAGKASTSQEFSDSGGYIDLEHNAIFTQPMVTIHKEDMIDDFLLGHHLFHGVDPNKTRSSTFDDPDAQIGKTTCGSCHFRDGRGSEIITTELGPRIAPPVFGLSLLDYMVGREAGYRWDGKVPEISDQVVGALKADHGVDAQELPGRVLELLTSYVELLTVPARKPGSYDLPGVTEGDVLFNDIGCAGCHTPVQRTSSSAPTHIRDLEIRPYTDMKIHDLGKGPFRTAPLWGLGHNLHLLERNDRATLFMHDGSATTIGQAIMAHGGEAASVTATYNGLSATDKSAVQAFVKTL